MPGRGVLISFEGGEGSGKSTQAARLLDHLTKQGIDAILTREPGGTPLGDWVRRLLLARPDVASAPEEGNPTLPATALTPVEEFLLFSAARASLVSKVIRPALEQGRVVLVDRYYHSSYAYQSAGGLEIAWMREVTERVVGDCVPDLVILLDLPAEQGFARNRGENGTETPDRFEMRGLAFHQRVREAYLQLASAEPERIRVVDAGAESGAVFSEVESIVGMLLAIRGMQPKRK